MAGSTPRRILVPVDFSPCSRRAAEQAGALAAKLEAAVELLHVWHSPEASADLRDWWQSLSDEERSGQSLGSYITNCQQGPLNEVAVAVRLAGAKQVTTRLEEGVPARVILERAANFDLVVIGTHGRSGFFDFLMGSTAERIARRSPVPVMMIPDPESGR